MVEPTDEQPRSQSPSQWQTIGSLCQLLLWRATECSDHAFLRVETGAPWTFGELTAGAHHLAAELEAVGVGPGNQVIVRIGNDEHFLPAVVACWLRGAAIVPMHPATTTQEVMRVLASIGAEAIICSPDDTLVNSSIGCPLVCATPLERGADVSDLNLTAPAVSGEQPAMVMLTSGSTGDPKGVVLSHDNAWASLRATVSAFRSDPNPSPLPASPKPPNLIANPLSHTAGIVRLLFALFVGRDVVLLRKFDGRMAQQLVTSLGINHLTLNPAMLRMLLDQVAPGDDLGPVRYASSGTAPLTDALREEFEARFGIPVLQAYGQTEAFGGVAIESVQDVLAGRRRPGSVGKALPGVELRLCAPDDSEVAKGEIGEIWVRSRQASRGYISTDATTPAEGDWLRTGDQGRLDEDGYLYITGRLKNIIICGGFNVVPEELEAAAAQVSRVSEASVVGFPDPRLGEIPVLVYEGSAEPDEVMAGAIEQLAAYKRPRHAFRVDSLPRVPNGKIDRTAVAVLVRSKLQNGEVPA